MSKARFLIISEQDNIFTFYKLIFKNYFDTIENIQIKSNESFDEIDFNNFDIVLIDLSTLKFLDEINKITKNNSVQNNKFILISPYELNYLSNFLKNIHFFNLILCKPLNIEKLKSFLRNETYKIERKNILEKKNHVLAKIIDLHPAKIAVYNLDGILFYANSNYLNSNNLTLRHIDNLHFNDISKCNLGFENIKEKLELTKSFTTQKFEDNKWLESIFYIITNEFIIHACNDITSQKQKEIQLEQSAIFFDNSNEGIVITDSNSKIISVNKSFCRITGYRKDEIIGKTPAILNSGIHDRQFYENMWESLKNNNSWQGEIWNKRKNGEVYPEWLSIAKAFNPKYNEEFYIAIFTDITTLKEADKKLHFYANHDVLTKLANRVQFEAHLKSSIEGCKRRNSKLALFFIDLDKFKEVNDTYGHSIGDEMLKIVAKRLEKSIRKEDFVARLGGDEFILIIKDVKTQEDMINLADKINENIKKPIIISEKVFFMTLSTGIAIFPEHGKDSEDLIKHADVAMYESKENGRNACTLYNQNMTEKISQKLSTQNELKIAISKDQFEMYYQAIINMKTKEIIAAEALVRWNHPNKGVLTPVHFINFIDESGLDIEFGELVFKKVLHDIQIINAKLKSTKFKIAINISSKYFFKNDFIEEIKEYCKDFLINPKQIELEILETNVMQNSIISKNKLEELNKLGFLISIDDFGTGYSSLSYLKNFKVNKLKIDQSFIRDFLEDNSDKAIVEAIINLARTFKLKVQAEGVETQEHEKVLLKLNCDLAQGYYYNKPISLTEFLNYLDNQNENTNQQP